MPDPARRMLSRALGLDEAEQTYHALQAMGSDRPISDRLLQHLGVTYRVAERDLKQIPRKGPVLVVANHPYGILESAVLATVLGQLRPDLRFLANGIITAIPEVRDLVIPVDVNGGEDAARSNQGGLRKALEFLHRGGLLVVFPAGEVSHFQYRAREVTDPAWNDAIARMIAIAVRRGAGPAVVPIYIHGANSLMFQAAGFIHPRLRTALLPRELLNKKRRLVDLRIGSAIDGKKLLEIPSDEERIQYLRWRTYLLANRNEYKARTSWPLPRRGFQKAAPEPVAPPVEPVRLASEITALSPVAQSGDLEVYLAAAHQIPAVLREIGRLREITFRAAGEGTGKALDVDQFDPHYLHLFVWNVVKQEVAGAYRLAGTDMLRRQTGRQGLYTANLFEYGDAFLDRLGPALELGRSFIRAEYQKGFAPLLLLWKGIGKYIAQNPRYKVLFGPVSISNQYQSLSREIMVTFLQKFASLRELASLVSNRNPYRPRPASGIPSSGFDIEDLSVVVSDLEPSRAGVPVLLRQYLRLGGKLLGFNVDPQFSNALDGLILVDLTKTERKLLERYLGAREASQFLAYQEGHHGTQ